MPHNHACCVVGCDEKYGTNRLHHFPKNERFDQWMRLTGNEILLTLTKEKIYQTAVICSKHFDKQLVYLSGRLAKHAIPTLFLPGKMFS